MGRKVEIPCNRFERIFVFSTSFLNFQKVYRNISVCVCVCLGVFNLIHHKQRPLSFNFYYPFVFQAVQWLQEIMHALGTNCLSDLS